MEQDERPEPYFGDYPHGAYWSAIRPEGAEARAVSIEEYFSDEGTSLRIMWDEGAGPLWGDGGLLGGDWQEQSQRLDSRGEALAARPTEEVGARYRVWHHS